LNSDGKVVGINVALAEGGQSVGFAIPGSAVYNAVESVKSTGRIVRPYLGIRYMNINDDVKTANHLSVNRGAFVKSNSPDEPAVLPHSPAEKAGIKSGDIVLDIDGILLDKDKSLAAIIRSHRVGDSINVRLLRDGKEKKLKVKLEELKN
jgi:S1-C subfamily serine protease